MFFFFFCWASVNKFHGWLGCRHKGSSRTLPGGICWSSEGVSASHLSLFISSKATTMEGLACMNASSARISIGVRPLVLGDGWKRSAKSCSPQSIAVINHSACVTCIRAQQVTPSLILVRSLSFACPLAPAPCAYALRFEMDF